MRATLVSFLVFGLLLFGSIVQACAYYTVLPDRVASHFNAAGVPDGWQSKEKFFLTHLGLVMGMAFVFLPLVYLGVRFGPAALIGMPHKGYWLAEPRQHETRVSLGSYGVWVINLSLGLIAAQMEAVYRANVGLVPNLGWWLAGCLAAFVLAMAIWLVSFYRRFGKPADEASLDP